MDHSDKEKAPETIADEAHSTTEAPSAATSTIGPSQTNVVESDFKRDSRFWLIFVALCCCTLLSALDLVGSFQMDIGFTWQQLTESPLGLGHMIGRNRYCGANDRTSAQWQRFYMGCICVCPLCVDVHSAQRQPRSNFRS